MRKQNPIYLFTALMSLGIAGFVLFLLVSTIGIPFYILAFVFFAILVGFVLMISSKLTDGSFEKRYQKLKECKICKAVIPRDSQFCPTCGVDFSDKPECEYCGHKNKVGAIVCENCNGLIK